MVRHKSFPNKVSDKQHCEEIVWLYFSAHSFYCVVQMSNFYYFWWIRMLPFEAIWFHMTVPPAVSHPVIVCCKAAAKLCDTIDRT